MSASGLFLPKNLSTLLWVGQNFTLQLFTKIVMWSMYLCVHPPVYSITLVQESVSGTAFPKIPIFKGLYLYTYKIVKYMQVFFALFLRVFEINYNSNDYVLSIQ